MPANTIITHGHTRKGVVSSEYSSWKHMRQRCYNPKHRMYPSYGARGIEVCQRWRNSFSNFLEDMGCKPDPTYSIDRINNDGNYEPSNCQWSNRFTQMRNTSRTRMITFNNQTFCVTDWARVLGLKQHSLLKRLARWPVEKALSTPPMVNFRRS